jgi:hypothetical protein
MTLSLTRPRCAGQAMIEYLIGCSTLGLLLFVPVAGGRPAILWIATALRDVAQGYGFLLSLS